MNYELVTIKEKLIVGYCARTSNQDLQMTAVIGGLWKKLFEEGGYAAITGKQGAFTYGVYSDYENGAEGFYDVTAGCQVSGVGALPEGMVAKTIPAGRYARYTAVDAGDPAAAGALWQEIWNTPLDRIYKGDFEEYGPAADGRPATLSVYIGVR